MKTIEFVSFEVDLPAVTGETSTSQARLWTNSGKADCAVAQRFGVVRVALRVVLSHKMHNEMDEAAAGLEPAAVADHRSTLARYTQLFQILVLMVKGRALEILLSVGQRGARTGNEAFKNSSLQLPHQRYDRRVFNKKC